MRKLWLMAAVALLGVTGCGGDAGAGSDPGSDSGGGSSSGGEVLELEACILDLINEVDAHAEPDDDWVDAEVDMTIYSGGEVWAQEASTARVDVEEELVRVAPNTIFTLGRPEPDVLELSLEEGQIWLNVEGLAPGETFQVETDAAMTLVRGTRFSVRAGAGGETLVSTQVGTVTVSAGGVDVTVGPGLETEVPPGGVPGDPEAMSPEEQIRWGMAIGSELDVVLPLVRGSNVYTYTGNISSRDWSADANYFALTYTDPQGVLNGTFIDATAGVTITSPLTWSVGGAFFNPAGDGFAYQSIDGPDEFYLCVGYMDGTYEPCFGGDGSYGWPYWSPDGEWLLFYSNIGGAFDLYRARPDGSEMTSITSEGRNNIRQELSPDGNTIAFVRADIYGGPGDVYLMDADGSNQRLLFEGVYGNGFDHLDWSPDGSALAIPAQTGGLYNVPADGSEATLLTGTEGLACRNPFWSPTPDGWPLVFYGYDAAQDRRGIWYVRDDGTEPQLWLDGSWGPDWSPDGRRVALGVTQPVGGQPQTRVYIFEAESTFWQ